MVVAIAMGLPWAGTSTTEVARRKRSMTKKKILVAN